MGKDLYDTFPNAKALFEQANEILGFPFTDIMFGKGGDAEVEAELLRQTENTQPALYIHSFVAMSILAEQGHQPDVVAGHSLGEYSALAAAGALSFADGLRAVRLRGELMAAAGTHRAGTMAAVIGLDDEVVKQICETCSNEKAVVVPANFNSPGQIVISGDVSAVEAAMVAMKEAGAKMVVQLSVSGAFHSPLMEYAVSGLADGLAKIDINIPRCPVYLNVTAQPSTNPDEIRQRLLDQLTAPVLWAQTLNQMNADGITSFLEVGAGNVLSGLVKRTIGRAAQTAQAGKAEQLQA
jgi:[acyl-carrier-protein] S-malonyltransferase